LDSESYLSVCRDVLAQGKTSCHARGPSRRPARSTRRPADRPVEPHSTTWEARSSAGDSRSGPFCPRYLACDGLFPPGAEVSPPAPRRSPPIPRRTQSRGPRGSSWIPGDHLRTRSKPHRSPSVPTATQRNISWTRSIPPVTTP